MDAQGCNESAASLTGCHADPIPACASDEYGVECALSPETELPSGCRAFASPPVGVELFCCPCGVGPADGPDAGVDAGVTCNGTSLVSSGGVMSYGEMCSDGYTYGVTVACPRVLTCEGPYMTVTRIWPGNLCDANGNVLGNPFALCGFPQ